MRTFSGVMSPKLRTPRPGAGEGVTPDELVADAQLAAHATNFVLEEQAQGLYQLQVHLLGQTAHVVGAT